jgi:putative alpha-1,2-mannosidase
MKKQKNNNILHFFVLLQCMFYLSHAVLAQKGSLNKSSYVDLFVCTSGDHGQVSPAATLPFGLVKLGPETVPTNHSGYDYKATLMKGFTINRMEGVGCVGSGANILIRPGLGKINQSAYPIDKSSEKSSPGYYKVKFTDPAIQAELTVTNFTGWQKFSYSQNGIGWIMIDLSHSLEKLIDEQHQIIGNRIHGSIQAPTNCINDNGAYKFYYDVEIDRSADSIREEGSVIWYFFSIKKGQTVNVFTSVSSVSPDQALNDRKLELGTADFEMIRKRATAAWNKKLNKITVKGKSEYEKLFYTLYYRSLLSPSDLSGPTGNYRGSDGKLYNAKGYTHYHGWCIWDNFRTALPLLTITEPDVMNDICKSLTDLYREGKKPLATRTEPFLTARTEHAVAVLLDCFAKGIIKFDMNEVYPLLKKETESYYDFSPDRRLESSYDYWALSKIAEGLGYKNDSVLFSKKAAEYKKNWRENFLPITEKSDIMHVDGLYEGTLWQYRWFVPFDIGGMQEMIGGKKQFTEQLEYFFDHKLYNHGNEPDIHAPFLFNYSDKPYLTQKTVNQILTKEMEHWYGTHVKWEKPFIGRTYKLDPKGYIPEMDDDVGTMSAWYVLSSMGIYPICPGEPIYTLTAPIFSSVSIQLPGNKTFRITAKNVSDENFYIQKVTLNGKNLNRSWIKHEEIINGGRLEFILGKTPNLSWGISKPESN